MLIFLLLTCAHAIQYYTLYFSGPISVALLRKLGNIIGYEPHDYLGNNTLLVHLDNDQERIQLQKLMPRIKLITPWEFTANVHPGLLPSRVTRFLPHKIDSDTSPLSTLTFPALAHDADTDEPVVDIRVHGHLLNHTDVHNRALHYSRTPITHKVVSPHIALLKNVHKDDASRLSDVVRQTFSNIKLIELRVPFVSTNRWSIPRVLNVAGGDQQLTPRTDSLRGNGQLLAIADTGISTGTCFFATPGVAVPFTNSQTVPLDNGNPTFRAYWTAEGDNMDAPPFGGHGTHVSGTAVGRPPADGVAGAYSGMASQARLVFTDLLPANATAELLNIPEPLDTTIFQWSLDCGAYVFSGSWGSTMGGQYGTDEQSVDKFTYFNRQFLPVFAAGNSGPAAGSIVSPAMAKNALAIGAVLNGIDAAELGGSDVNGSPSNFDDYWLEPFSSVGSIRLPFRKPDVVAPGGVVWSQASDAPNSPVCTSLELTLAGMQGTSMATPAVAGAVILLRQYFVDGLHTSGLVPTNPPMASLLRATIVSSAVPLLGVFPQTPFATTQQRIDSEGHGRVALNLVLPSPNVQFIVLANEDASMALATGSVRRWCVQILGAYQSLSVVMAYADYPSFPNPPAPTILVNDLRLRVYAASGAEFSINRLDIGIAEIRSTIERANVTSTNGIRVEVSGSTIGFGDVQTFSLVLALIRPTNASQLVVAGPTSTDSCVYCGNQLVVSSQCAVCGNGIVEVGEQCDESVCCSSNCKLLADKSPCSVSAGTCQLSGTCRADLNPSAPCIVNMTAQYVMSPSGGSQCAPMTPATTTPIPPTTTTSNVRGAAVPVATKSTAPATTSAPTMCSMLSADEWREKLASDHAFYAPTSETLVCCRPLWAAVEQIDIEPLFTNLTREYAAALLNAAQPGVSSSAELLTAIATANTALESVCGVGFVDVTIRQQVVGLANELYLSNGQCDGTNVIEPLCSPQNLDDRLCSPGGGTFDQDTGTCDCHANRQPGEPECAHLSCIGNGASEFDYTLNTDRCICFAQWTGAACSQCAVPTTADIKFLCIGTPTVLVEQGAPRYLWDSVITATLASRMNDTFYPASVAKAPDALPGTQQLDCACRMPNETIDWRNANSHAAVLTAAIVQQVALRVWMTRAEALLTESATMVTSTTDVQEWADTKRPKSSGGNQRGAKTVCVLIFLWAFNI